MNNINFMQNIPFSNHNTVTANTVTQKKVKSVDSINQQRTKIINPPLDSADGSEASPIIIIPVPKVSAIEDTIKQGDWVFFDIDGTLLQDGSHKCCDSVREIDVNTGKMIQALQAKGIKCFALTARSADYAKTTLQHLQSTGINFSNVLPSTIEKNLNKLTIFSSTKQAFRGGVLFAKRDKVNGELSAKGQVLKAFLKAVNQNKIVEPKRIIFIDNEEKYLKDVAGTDLGLKKLQMNVPNVKLYHFINGPLFKSCSQQDQDIFPAELSSLKYVETLSGGTGGVHVLKDNAGNKFTFKVGSDSHLMKEEILADAIYLALGIPVPDFAVYDKVPECLRRNGISIKHDSPYRLSRFIEGKPESDVNRSEIERQLRENFIIHAFLGNWDIVTDLKNVILAEDGKVYCIDNGGSLRYRALGLSKSTVKNWSACAVTDIATLRDPNVNKDGERIFGGLSDDQIKHQAQQFLIKANTVFNLENAVAHGKSPQSFDPQGINIGLTLTNPVM